MNCETVSGYLPELLAGVLGRETELEVLTHLARCEDCRKELAFWARVSEAAVAEETVMPTGLFEDVRQSIFGSRVLTTGESLRLVGHALGLARSVCMLALSVTGTGI